MPAVKILLNTGISGRNRVQKKAVTSQYRIFSFKDSSLIALTMQKPGLAFFYSQRISIFLDYLPA